MKKIGILFFFAILIGACNSTANKNAASENEMVTLTVDELMASPEDYLDKEVNLTGLVTHVCRHGGQKLFVAGGNEGLALRVNTSENIPEFSVDLEGTNGEFTGTVKVMTEELIAETELEETEHHPEGEGMDEDRIHAKPVSGEKTYYIEAKSFKTL